ncbi:hypothetical protein SCHPADRAFT_835082 [Schizopora paradoxa]|uniref:Protein kinase domain-containing protein n=1 Tax=Schizopora paradoxa TaxID=27342 RepID=A0A0H2RB65_9AGAM|nr:hypothetical protein SCHPADRAFT_835082 [Schizopora paradoxa]
MAAAAEQLSSQSFDDDDAANLRPHEIYWRDLYTFFLDQGYQFRPRFRPGWVPSWLGSTRYPMFFEDSNPLLFINTIDAVRLQDGSNVFIKRIDKDSTEAEINIYLSSPTLRSNPSNHAVPCPDYISGEGIHDFIVMPVLRRFNDPPFVFVDEVLDFIRQTLEGLVFLHRNGIAHRDCSDNNLMFDASSMYPEGFHPDMQYMTKDGLRLLGEGLKRADVSPPVRYYFIDFGISSRFAGSSKRRLVTGSRCQDRDVPELSDAIPYDPFYVDVFILGNVYKRSFTNAYSNLSFLKPLVYEMTKLSPNARSSAEQALRHFRRLVEKQRGPSLRWTLMESDMTFSERFNRNLLSVNREVRRFAKNFLGGWMRFA